MQDVFKAQFIKSYYNMGMIYDRLGDINKANAFYKKAIDRCEGDPLAKQQSCYLKAMTNYAVTLEKLGRRPEALNVLEALETHFADEIRIHNNMGII